MTIRELIIKLLDEHLDDIVYVTKSEYDEVKEATDIEYGKGSITIK